MRRIAIQVSFKKPRDWTQPYEAIIDTGAPVSILPPAIWQEIEKEILGEYKIQGIVPKKDSYLPVKIANVFCILMDEKNITDTLKIKAYLALEEKAPLLLGFESIISRAKLYINSENSEGYIEIYFFRVCKNFVLIVYQEIISIFLISKYAIIKHCLCEINRPLP